MKVLFCGDHFSGGFHFTKDAIYDVTNGSGEVNAIQCIRDEVPLHLADVDVIIPLMTKITAEMISQAPLLKMIMQFGIGVEGIDIAAASARGIFVCNIPSEGCGNAQSCAELCIFLAMSLLRDIHGLKDSLLHGRLGLPIGRTIYGSTALIIGYGGMGRQLLPRLLAFGVERVILVSGRSDIPENEIAAMDDKVEVISFDQLQTASKHSINIDLCFLCCGVNDGTRGLVNKQFIAKFLPGFYLINVARGCLINHADLTESLDSGIILGAGLDVFHTEPFPVDDPLLSHPKVVATPHVGGVTDISYRNMAKLVAENSLRIFRNEKPIGILNGL